MSAHVHAFLELANSGYTQNVEVNDAGDLSCLAAASPCGTSILREQNDGRFTVVQLQ
jgi:hypothetical protein